jgi:hypothetical protein
MNNKILIILVLMLSISVLFLTCGPKTYTLTISIEPSDIAGTVDVSPSSDDNTYEPDTEVTLTATAESGYEFSKWTDGEDNELTAETDGNLVLTMDSDKTVKTVFIEQPILSVTATPASDVTSGTLTISTSPDKVDFTQMIQHNYTDTQFTAEGSVSPGNYYIRVEDNNDTGDACWLTVDPYDFEEGETYIYEVDMNTGNVSEDTLGVGELTGPGFEDCSG